MRAWAWLVCEHGCNCMHVHAIVWWGECGKVGGWARCAMHARVRAHSGWHVCMGGGQAGGWGACMVGRVRECMGSGQVGEWGTCMVGMVHEWAVGRCPPATHACTPPTTHKHPHACPHACVVGGVHVCVHRWDM